MKNTSLRSTDIGDPAWTTLDHTPDAAWWMSAGLASMLAGWRELATLPAGETKTALGPSLVDVFAGREDVALADAPPALQLMVMGDGLFINWYLPPQNLPAYAPSQRLRAIAASTWRLETWSIAQVSTRFETPSALAVRALRHTEFRPQLDPRALGHDEPAGYPSAMRSAEMRANFDPHALFARGVPSAPLLFLDDIPHRDTVAYAHALLRLAAPGAKVQVLVGRTPAVTPETLTASRQPLLHWDARGYTYLGEDLPADTAVLDGPWLERLSRETRIRADVAKSVGRQYEWDKTFGKNLFNSSVDGELTEAAAQFGAATVPFWQPDDANATNTWTRGPAGVAGPVRADEPVTRGWLAPLWDALPFGLVPYEEKRARLTEAAILRAAVRWLGSDPLAPFLPELKDVIQEFKARLVRRGASYWGNVAQVESATMKNQARETAEEARYNALVRPMHDPPGQPASPA
jgi:hypothetical protein